MPSIVWSIAASASSGLWMDERINDDRFLVDAAAGLALVVDASGPTYGGYHAPFAIDPGVASFIETFTAGHGPTRERLVSAVRAAHAVMRAMYEDYEAQRAGRVGLEAARKATDAVRPQAWKDYEALAHFMGSLTACAVGPDAVVVAQVGECRAYSLRDQVPALLVPDHTLPSVLEASGASREEVEQARRDHSSVVVALLGSETLHMNVVEIAAPTTIALVTNGVWQCNAELEEAFRMQTRDDLSRLVLRCSKAARDDATAVVFTVS
ncbi:MAG: hypothetical protein ACOY0T_32750 [Myxococcota bacterium]